MKHLIVLFLCLASMHSFGQTLLNADFETGTLEGWEEKAGGTKFVSDTEAYSGSFCSAIEGRGRLEQVITDFEPGQDYILTFYVKAVDGGRANVGVQNYGRGKAAVTVEDTVYQKMEVRFRMGLETTSGTIFIYNLKSSGIIYVFEFKLVHDTKSAWESSLPAPPDGFMWEMIPHLSDEFDGDELDADKWLDYHPYWDGRDPSEYNPDNIEVADGVLKLKNTSRIDDMSEVDHPNEDIWVDASVITSKNRDVSYGYYEARVKESMVSVMSAFWFQGKYSEIDVIENIGAPSDKTSAERSMNMNTHYYPGGWANDQKTPRKWIMPYPAGEDYHVYGMWWIDKRHINLYHNGVLTTEIELPGDYDEPMYLFFDTEVFTWQGLPTIESLKDDSLNTYKVDWVRSWELVEETTGMEPKTEITPQKFGLLPNYPNPFNPETHIHYRLEKESDVCLSIINAVGETVRVLENKKQSSGYHSVLWDGLTECGTHAASGIYFTEFIMDSHKTVQKMMMIR